MRRSSVLPASSISLGLLFAVGFLHTALAVASTPSPTTTELTISSGNSVAVGTLVTLTASVSSSSAPVSPGLVLFCNAKAAYCQDLNILGQAQLTANGTASVNLILPIGSHQIRAEFRGTVANAPSSSSTVSLTVNGKYPTTTTFQAYQGPNYLEFGTTITGFGKTAPTGTLALKDNTNHQLPITTVMVGPSTLSVVNIGYNTVSSVTGAVADFNRDGRLDQLAYDSANNNVVAFFGAGDGTFTAGPSIPVGTNPDAIAVGDFNNDDKLDFAVANFGDGTVSIFLGKGDGSFSAPTTISVGQSPNTISVGDFNNDGNVDMVVSSALGSSVWLGDGRGDFATLSSQNLPRAISPIRVADINGDGIADLTYIDPDYLTFVYLGTGLGTFNKIPTYPAPCDGVCKDAIVADFNGDGKPDVALAGAQGVLVALGTGDGKFGSPIVVSDTLEPLALFVGDFNSDGKLDISETDRQVGTNLFLGNGEGKFAPYETGNNYMAAAGDFNGDGFTDLAYTPTAVALMGWPATAGQTGLTLTGAPGIHSVFANYGGDAAHAASVSSPAPVQGPKAASSVNLEASPTPVALGQTMQLVATISPPVVGDVRPTGTVTFSNGPNTLGVVPVDGGKAVFSTTTLPIGSNISLTAFYSGDSTFSSGVSLPVPLMARGTLRPSSTTELSVSPSSTIAQGAVVTLSATVLNAGHPVPRGLVVFYSSTSAHPGKTVLGQAQLTPSGVATMKFRPPAGSLAFKAAYQGTNTLAASESASQSLSVTASIATSTSIAVDPPTYSATVTSYGLLAASGQVSFADATYSNKVFATAPLGPSINQFSLAAAASPNVGSGQYLMKVADFNGDGILDSAAIAGPGLSILLGKPDGSFTQGSTANISQVVRDLTVADFNGDGVPDIAVLQDEPASVAVFLGRGDGTFISQPPIPVGQISSSNSIVSGDFNGDGNADLLMTDSFDGNVAVLLGNGNGGFRAGPSSNLGGPAASYSIVADFNGDGIADVATLFDNYSEYQAGVSILLGNGDGTFVTNIDTLYQCDESISTFAEADFNGDGFPDIVVGPCGVSSGPNILVLLGNGNGTFTLSGPSGPAILPFTPPYLAVAGDLNGDGIPDVILNNTNSAQIGILLGKGDGTFVAGPVLSVPGGAAAGQMAVADFNGDGVPDLLTTAQSNYYTGDEDVTTMFEWFSTITQTSQATAKNVTVPGNGTQQVYAAYPGDATHIGSVSATVPVGGAAVAH